MSIGSFGGVAGSAAGAPLSAAKGTDTERASKDATAQARTIDTDKKAEKAAGIGQTEEDQATSDRDADGRRLWEQMQEHEGESGQGEPQKKSKDTSGNSGNSLDLTG